MKHCVAVCMAFFSFMFLPISARESIESLLAGYLANNLTLKNLSLAVQDRMLAAQATGISNTFSVELSSGTLTVTTGKETTVSLKPSASLSIPQASNLTFKISSDISIRDGERRVNSTSLSAGIDIYSGKMESRKISLLKAERDVLEARRNLQNGFLSQEKQFYSELKALYEAAAKISSAEKDLYDDAISFEQVRVQGYDTKSLKYRQLQMAVATDRRNVENYRRSLERDTKIFAKKCGMTYTGTNALDFLPLEIAAVSPLDVLSFDKHAYTKIESAVWTHYINGLTRKADKSVTISGSAGYTFNNSQARDQDTFDLGTDINLDNSGLLLSAGVSEPTDFSSPTYTFGVTIKPSQFLLHNITIKQNDIASEQELTNIAVAENNYDTSVISQQTALDNLLWQQTTNKESFDLYDALERDSARWYKSGIITESEYRSAAVNKEKYRLQCIIDAIELIIYNDETRLLFTRDGELRNEE